METLRPRAHDRCGSCSRLTYDIKNDYCLGCGHSEKNPVLEVLAFVFIALAALAVFGWLMS